jgi:hypothetical protein
MNTQQSSNLSQAVSAPEAQGRPQLSASARDAGDRVCCGLLIAAVAVATALGAAWFWGMPSFR